jgi:hypothetical protein
VFVGGAFFFGPSYYYPYGPGYYYPLPEPVYIEQDSAEDAAQFWYYCPAARTYYPYIGECPGGWQRVVPEPDPQPPSG